MADTDSLERIRKAMEAGPTPGPWRWWTSCSFRRLSSDETGGDGDVLCAVIQRSDGHPDIHATEATREFIAACNPVAIRSLLAREAALREALDDVGDCVAIEVMHYIREMYPDALKAIPKCGATSIRNIIVQQTDRFIRDALASTEPTKEAR